jgi:AraC-like DNA-binding protein
MLARAASLQGFHELVVELGGNPDDLLTQAGLPSALVADPDQLISGHALCRVLDLAADTLQCPSFGLLLSQRQGISMLGPIGLLIKKSASFQDVFAMLHKYLSLHSELISFDLDIHGTHAVLRCFSHAQGADHGRQVIDLTLGVGCNIVRLYAGANWRPQAVYVQHQAPSDCSTYALVFHAPLRFAQEFNGVVFDAQLLQVPLRSFEADMQSFLGQYLDRQRQARGLDVVSQVRTVITTQLPKGRSSLQDVANVMRITPRTLQRQLAKQAVTFQALLDDVRKQTALAFLRSGTQNLTELAQILGYADLSVFSRAFKHWFGVSPSQFDGKSSLNEAIHHEQ